MDQRRAVLSDLGAVTGALAGWVVTNQYDGCLRRTTLAALQSNTPLVQQSFGYDKASRLSSVNDGNGDGVAYNYLAESPLVGQIGFTNGSATRMATTKTYDDLNRLTQISSQPSAAGVPALAFNYNYNPANQRTQDKLADGSYWVYQFTTLNFLYDGWNPVAVLNSPSSILQSFMWGSDLSGSLQGAGGVGGLLEVSYHGTATTNCFPAFDGNGNLSALANAADGTVVANYEYGPFGEVIRATGPMAKANPMRFSTKYQDDESDLLYYGYRYYKASTGTWLSRDPDEEDGGNNLYAFVENNAVNDVDNLGEYDIDFHYYAIYYLLRAKCYIPEWANSVATASQGVDDNPVSNPLILGAEAAFGNLTATLNLRNYHFYQSGPMTPTHRNPHDLGGGAAVALLSQDWATAGRKLHTFADSWAHEGFTAWPCKAINLRTDSFWGKRFHFVGHIDAPMGGHAPDYPFTDVPKAVEAAMTIYDLIPGWCCVPPLDRSTVQSDLQSTFSFVNQDDEARVQNFQDLIQRRFGERPTYVNPYNQEPHPYPIGPY